MIQSFSNIHHQHIDSSRSTNIQLIEQIKSSKIDSSDIHVLTANRQLSGRGQYGKQWQSPQGNIYLSLYYPLAYGSSLSGLLSLCVGYQLTQLSIIQKINNHRTLHNKPLIGVKWVNDIGYYHNNDRLRGNQFHKLAGILIEPISNNGKLIGVVIGVGVNVQNAPILSTTTPNTTGNKSVCLQQLVQHNHSAIEPQQLYNAVIDRILQSIKIYQDMQGNSQLLTRFFADFRSVDLLYDRQIKYKKHADNWISGRSIGINDLGGLQLQQDDGSLCVLFSGDAQFSLY